MKHCRAKSFHQYIYIYINTLFNSKFQSNEMSEKKCHTKFKYLIIFNVLKKIRCLVFWVNLDMQHTTV